MKNKVVALSGYSGSGKTTVCKYIKENSDYIYFDFGFLFRPLTYYLINELKLNDEQIKEYIDKNLFKDLNFTYILKDKEAVVGVNNIYYDNSLLNTPLMNMKSVMVGSMIGDKLNYQLEKIIDYLKQKNNVLLNARRPVSVYPKLDKHLFLTASFDERVRRKMKMNKESFADTYDKLSRRDILEKESGFLNTYSFTKIIDTTNLSKDEVIKAVIDSIDQNINITSLNNLTLILGSYKCNKNCPYCIAKNNQKFDDDKLNLVQLNNLLLDLRTNNIQFNRFVLSGNGEPSLYSYQLLVLIRDVIKQNSNLFNKFRLHSSGNIFFEENKFNLFNTTEIPFEIEVLRTSLDSKIDMNILGYNNDYLQSDLFSKSNNIKCDIALTEFLNIDTFKDDLYTFLLTHPTVKSIRLKKLMPGDNLTKQRSWVLEHTLSDDIINNFINNLNLEKRGNTYKSKDGIIVYKPSGNYERDLVINNGIIKDYDYNEYSLEKIKRKYGVL